MKLILDVQRLTGINDILNIIKINKIISIIIK